MKRRAWLLVLAMVVALGMVAFGSACSSDDSEEEAEYVSESEISDVFSNPNDYVGKYIVLTGQVFNKIDSDDEEQSFQAFYDTQNSTDDFLVYCSSDTDISENEYVEVNGKILGSESRETALGETRDILSIDAKSVSEKSYIDVVVPATKEIEPEDATAKQHDVSITVDKVEYAETETRIWITMKNDSSENVNIYPNLAQLVQNGKQYEYNSDSMSIFESDEEAPADSVVSGASSSGMLVFPAINSAEEFQLCFNDCTFDDMEPEFDQFKIKVPAAE